MTQPPSLKLKSGKASGLDKLSSEHFLHAPAEIDVHLALLFHVMLKHSYIPDDFMSVKIQPIVKDRNEDTTSSRNYRPIAIATAISKIFELCALDNSPCLTETSDNQFGYKKGHSTDQCVFQLKERIRRYVELGGPVYCTFIDASKAFDRVCHATLFLRLLDIGVSSTLVKLLTYWYRHQTMYTQWNSKLSMVSKRRTVSARVASCRRIFSPTTWTY